RPTPMPRGNDTADAVQELAASLGQYQNAEDLIRSWRANRDKDVVAVGLQQRDEDASKDLDKDKIDSAIGDDVELVDAVVRGGKISAIVRDKATRRTKKTVIERDGSKFSLSSDPFVDEAKAMSTTEPVPESEG